MNVENTFIARLQARLKNKMPECVWFRDPLDRQPRKTLKIRWFLGDPVAHQPMSRWLTRRTIAMAKVTFNGPLEQIDACCYRIPKSYKAGMRVDGLIFANEKLM